MKLEIRHHIHYISSPLKYSDFLKPSQTYLIDGEVVTHKAFSNTLIEVGVFKFES